MAKLTNNVNGKVHAADPSKGQIDVATDIFDNHDEVKAHIMIFGNKLFLFKLSGDRKKDDCLKEVSQSVFDSLTRLRRAKAAGSVDADSDLQDATKRRRVAKAFAPSPNVNDAASVAGLTTLPSAKSSAAASKPTIVSKCDSKASASDDKKGKSANGDKN